MRMRDRSRIDTISADWRSRLAVGAARELPFAYGRNESRKGAFARPGPFAWCSANNAHFLAVAMGANCTGSVRSPSWRSSLIQVQPVAPAPVETRVEYPYLMLSVSRLSMEPMASLHLGPRTRLDRKAVSATTKAAPMMNFSGASLGARIANAHTATAATAEQTATRRIRRLSKTHARRTPSAHIRPGTHQHSAKFMVFCSSSGSFQLIERKPSQLC